MKRRYIPFVLFAALLMACSCGSLSSLITATSTPSGNGTGTGSNPTLTGSGPTLPAPSGNSPGYDQAQQMGGQWSGTWNNTTYGSSGNLAVTIAVNPDGTASADVTLGGNILGVGSPSPLHITGTYDNNGVTLGGKGLPIFGDLNVTIDTNGILKMTASNLPVTAISQVSADGTVSSTEFQFTYTVTFANGSTANGTANLTKTP